MSCIVWHKFLGVRQVYACAVYKTAFCLLTLALIFCCSVRKILAQNQQPPVTQDEKTQTQQDITDLSIEDLMKIEVASVYSASKYVQKVTEAPSSVTIVTSDEIRKYGHRTLADILRSVRGFYVTNDRNYSYIGVRGFARPGDYNTRVLLLVNGHRINDNVYDLALIGTELPIDVDLIDRVEIIRGPSSSLYGTSAFFATINVISKRGQDLKGVEVSGEVSSFGTYKGRASYGNKFDNGLELLLSGSYYDSRGPRHLYIKEFDDPATNNGIAERADDDQSKNFFANVSFRDFTLRGAYGSREKGIPTGAYDTVFNDSRTRTTDRRGYLDLQYEHTFENKLGITARVYYDKYHYDGTYVYDYSDNNTPLLILNIDTSRGEWWGGEVQLTKTLLRRHKVTFGTEYRDNLRQDQANLDLPANTRYIDDRRESKNVAFYLQDEFAISENVTISAGVRYDHHSTFGGITKPRLGLIYHPAKKTTLKLLYGEAFRAPNSYELYYGAGTVFKTNPDLRPENIKTSELVLEQYLGDHVRLSASGYIYRISGLISQQIDQVEGLITFRNTEKIESQGLELEMDTKLAGGFEGRFGYTLQDTQDQQTKQTLTNSPRHLGKLNLIAPLLKKKIFAGLELQYTSKRKTLDGTDAQAVWLPNFTLFSQKLVRGLDLSFSVYNLFDRKYGDPGAVEHRQNTIEQNGRNFRLKLTYRF
ncbi:MAG: TonB-dependent receptor [Acidobacteriota bacterium]